MAEEVDFKDTGVYDPCAVNGDVERPRRNVGARASVRRERESSCRAAGEERGCLGSLIALLATVACAAAVVGSLLRFLPAPLAAAPFVPVLASVGPWWALVAFVAMVLGFLARRKAGVIVLSVAVICLQFCLNVPAWSLGQQALPEPAAQPSAAAAQARTLRTMTLNTYFGGADPEAICQLVDRYDIEVLCLHESTPDLVEALKEAGLEEALPYFAGREKGSHIWSAYPLEDVDPDAVGYDGSHMPAATVEVDGARVRVVSVHTCAPIPGYEEYWFECFDLLENLGEEDEGRDPNVPYLLLGDFNATFDHEPFRAVLAKNGLVDAARSLGLGLAFTWPSQMVGLAPVIAIDHALAQGGLEALEFRTFEVMGTDHLALVVTYRVDPVPVAVTAPGQAGDAVEESGLGTIGFTLEGYAVQTVEPNDDDGLYQYDSEDAPAAAGLSDLDPEQPWVWIEDGRVMFIFEDGEVW